MLILIVFALFELKTPAVVTYTVEKKSHAERQTDQVQFVQIRQRRVYIPGAAK